MNEGTKNTVSTKITPAGIIHKNPSVLNSY